MELVSRVPGKNIFYRFLEWWVFHAKNNRSPRSHRRLNIHILQREHLRETPIFQVEKPNHGFSVDFPICSLKLIMWKPYFPICSNIFPPFSHAVPMFFLPLFRSWRLLWMAPTLDFLRVRDSQAFGDSRTSFKMRCKEPLS